MDKRSEFKCLFIFPKEYNFTLFKPIRDACLGLESETVSLNLRIVQHISHDSYFLLQYPYLVKEYLGLWFQFYPTDTLNNEKHAGILYKEICKISSF